MRRSCLTRAILLAQGIYYVLTGIWPFVSMRSFEAISGRKRDHWLVKTVGALITVVGGVLLLAGVRRREALDAELPLVAVGSAAALTAVDVVYTAQRRISPVYLLEAFAELTLMLGWLLAWRKGK